MTARAWAWSIWTLAAAAACIEDKEDAVADGGAGAGGGGGQGTGDGRAASEGGGMGDGGGAGGTGVGGTNGGVAGASGAAGEGGAGGFAGVGGAGGEPVDAGVPDLGAVVPPLDVGPIEPDLGAGGAGGAVEPEPCERACGRIADCSTGDDPDLCPGFDAGDREGLVAACLPNCNPALAEVIGGFGTCEQLVEFVSNANPPFAESCAGPGGEEVPTREEVQAILNARCDGCHIGGHSAGMSLAGDFTIETVGVPANEAPLARIEPGDRERSYLYHKIRGTQAEAGGGGLRMPRNGPPYLSDDQIETIGAWIDAQ